MPSFDIVSRLDLQELDNAVNNVRKEIAGRFDFKGVHTELDLNKKDKKLVLVTGDEMKVKAVRDLLIGHCVKRKVDPKFLEFGEPEATSKGQLRVEVSVNEGIDKELGKKINKMIKDAKLKVQSQIQDDQLRVTAKKIDDLQSVIRLLDDAKLERPLQYVNMKR